MHPDINKLKNRKKNYDWSKSTDNGNACGAAKDSDCPDSKPNRRLWHGPETVGCDACQPAERGSPIAPAANSNSRLQVAQASRRQNSLIDCDED